MKEVITVKMVEQKEVKYIADDGKVFDKEYDCIKHEAGKRVKEVDMKFSMLDRKTLEVPIADWYRCEGCTYKLTLHSRDDLDTFVNYYLAHHFMVDYIKDVVAMVDSYPYTTIVDEGYESIAFVNIKDFSDKIHKLIKDLDYDKGEDKCPDTVAM